MRVVATGAVHFSLTHGMMGKFVLGANLLFVAGNAGIRYGYAGELITGHYPRSRMDRMAGGARDMVDVMNTVRPEKPVPLLMAFETGLVPEVSRGWRPPGKANQALEGFAC